MKEILIPSLGESIVEATIAKWYKKPGQFVTNGQVILEVETEKVTMEVASPCDGVLQEILQNEGSTVAVGQLVGKIAPGDVKADDGFSASSPAITQEALPSNLAKAFAPNIAETLAPGAQVLAPSVRKIVAENALDPAKIQGTGKDGRISKIDALNAVSQSSDTIINNTSDNKIERVPMSRLRKTIAQRLKESQNTAAILTTFNEVDMSQINQLRQQYKEVFEKRHGSKLGFMSFFVKAIVSALQEIPSINAQIDGNDIIYKNYYDIGVAVGTNQGLVVPILRGADTLGFAEIELAIASLGKKAREGKLTMADLSGGTFSISNGGTYGSLLSTPIINPPQSGILGMHKIQERAVVINGKIEIRPMMYLALSYDHRLVDGKEAVTFLVRVKELLEAPEKLLLDL